MEKLKFVYHDGTISKELIRSRSIDEIRGLMISDNVEMEIKIRFGTFLEAKATALMEVAELFSVNEAELYVRSYPAFVKTLLYLTELGYSSNLDQILPSYSFWCKDVFRKHIVNPLTICPYRLIHRHYENSLP